MSLQVDTRSLLAAITLADELNFTRTAERLKITQPALSKQIAELESRIGVVAFKRKQGKVELTEAGQVLVRGCKDAIALFERSVHLARTTHGSTHPVLTIGHSTYVDPRLVSAVLSIHLPLYPDLRLRMESMFAFELVHAVLSAELDLAIITGPSENSLLTIARIDQSPLCVAMPADHPAVKRSNLSIQDLGGVGWMIFSRKSHPIIYERVMESGRLAGVSPVELHHYVSPQKVTQLITENFGIAFVAEGVSDSLKSREIAVRPLSEKSLQLTSYLVLRADESSRLVNEFGRAFLRKGSER